MDLNKGKRARGSNFTKEEVLLLVRSVSKLQDIIESQVTDKVNNQEKNEAWQKVREYFCASNNTVRSVEQLKTKYENLKAKARKVAAQQRSFITGTGGGSGKVEPLDPVLEAILEIINKKTVVGLHSPWDSDSQITVTSVVIEHENVTSSNVVRAYNSNQAYSGIGIL
ncbi:unnamed protein product [Acanthoscelides obtectus]|uniref:Regulatory protein zeste n=1 Tax=Acanthoscelides obtectus TaxID=200917 RepID=A0A9P0PB00_ACAOB|nr:unnamed protein product [Acanthoscelides obtectus]CAK1664848.1 hypothetical protein AOBTE_LOCUS24505 [Acanthoscelides obtectus]